MAAKTKDILGCRFGYLMVLRRAESPKRGQAAWLCQCDCGATAEYMTWQLCGGRRKSCGCRKYEGKLPPGEAGLRSVFCGYRAGARRRGIPFELSLSDFGSLVRRPCTYCGSEPQQRAHLNGRSSRALSRGTCLYSGLDRVDSSKPYNVSNVVPCCKTCNYAKNDMSTEQFEAWITRAFNHLTHNRKNQ
jgi:5-methylcytosine-specific restriction endonuclease McrA